MAETAPKTRLSKHGSVRRYKQGCRCEPCMTANTEARRRERERAAAKAGKPVPTTRKRVPTEGAPVPTPRRPTASGDELTAVIEDAIFEHGGTQTAASVAAENLRALGYRAVVDDPIQAAARRALPAIGGDSALSELRRETAYRAAAVADNPKAAPFFKSAAEVLRLTIEDLIAAAPPKDGEADALGEIMATLGGSRGRGSGRRGPAAVDDAAESGT